MLDDGVIYLGSSAGSYICCPTIETATWGKDNNNVGLTDFTAMNLVPFLMKAHFQEEQREFLKEKVAESDYEVKVLNDDQALLVNADQVELLGGPEIKL